MTSGSFWNFHEAEKNNSAIKNNGDGNKINNNKTTLNKSFEYKTKLIGSTPNDHTTLNAEVVVPLKYLSNFWRFLDLPLINCEIELDLSWSKECIISEISITPVAAIKTIRVTFQINNAKLYVPVVTLSINDDIKFLEDIKQRFKRTIS